MAETDCPCGRRDARGTPLAVSDCCALVLCGQPAADAEALMRSRYTAFVQGRADHLLATWHPGTRPAEIVLEVGQRWLGLEVQAHRRIDDDHAEVEFVARSRLAGRGHRLHERSRFVREAGRWYYVDGDVY